MVQPGQGLRDEEDAHARRDQLEEMVAAGKLGKKSGQGFYTWEGGVKR